MGLKLGEKVEKLNVIRVVSVRRESLERMLLEPAYGQDECIKEGFSDLTPEQFVSMFLKHNRKMNIRDSVTRIEFYYPSAEEVDAILADMAYVKQS